MTERPTDSKRRIRRSKHTGVTLADARQQGFDDGYVLGAEQYTAYFDQIYAERVAGMEAIRRRELKMAELAGEESHIDEDAMYEDAAEARREGVTEFVYGPDSLPHSPLSIHCSEWPEHSGLC